jgi:hypothetical protein
MNEAMNKLFNSQVCTTKEQSQHLLDLGLKPETVDMSIITTPIDCDGIKYSLTPYSEINHPKIFGAIPAWSLHGLIEMMPTVITQDDYSLILGVNATCVYYADDEYAETFNDPECNLYDCVVKCIEWLIKEGHFNKDYLKQ